MISLTNQEKKAILIIFKDLSSYYNAHTLSKLLDMSHVGTQKLCKRLEKNNILLSQRIGKSLIYKLNLNDDYVQKLITFILSDQAQEFKRWKEEFKALNKKGRIIILFGSTIKNYEKASDIDLMTIIEKKEIAEVNRIQKEKQNILSKKLHSINIIHKDFLENLKKRDKVILDVIMNGVVLFGQEEYVEVIKNVTRI